MRADEIRSRFLQYFVRNGHEEISSSRDHSRLEAIDSGEQIVELGTRFAPCEEHLLLPQPSRNLQRGEVSLFPAMRVERFLLLLKGFLSHPSSTFCWVCSINLQVP